MNKLDAICIFCGSSEGNDNTIIEEAKRLGKIFAEQEIQLVYGGSKLGIMGHAAKSCLDHQGKVIGVIPEFLKVKEVVHLGLTELHTTDDMHGRKLKMQEISDGFIALPGGFGTLEELFEIITWSQLGLHHKPIGLLNVDGFFDHLKLQLEEMVRKGFLKMENFDLLITETNIDRLLEKMKHFETDKMSKWLKPERT
ncbi:MAG: TIGR00730 family Rossman fold protein [Leeuwenhoekiella sp.]